MLKDRVKKQAIISSKEYIYIYPKVDGDRPWSEELSLLNNNNNNTRETDECYGAAIQQFNHHFFLMLTCLLIQLTRPVFTYFKIKHPHTQ